MPQNYRLLSKDEVSKLSKNGHQLDTSQDKMYFIVGLFDDKPNQSADPESYEIPAASLDKIAKSFIGRPFVWKGAKKLTEEEAKQNYGSHIRGKFDDPKKIIEFQKDFAIAEMVSYYKNPRTNKVYGIFEAYDEYKDVIEKQQLEPYTSTLVEPRQYENGILSDGIGLHVMAVDDPGYSKQLAKIHGTCTGMLNECTAELRTLGSSKKLREFREKVLNTSSSLGSSMSLDNNKKEMTNLELTGAVLTLQSGQTEMQKSLSDISTAIQNLKPGSLGSAGNDQQLVQLPKEELEKLTNGLAESQKELQSIKDERTAEQKQILEKQQKADAKLRLEQATIIANGEKLLKKNGVTDENLQERIKYWNELKNETSGQLVDLSLLAIEYKTINPNTLGSAGMGLDIYPEMSDTPGNDTMSIMEDIGSA